jgi:hypothetical protein
MRLSHSSENLSATFWSSTLDSIAPGAKSHNRTSGLVGLVSTVAGSGFELLDCALQPFLMG